MTKTDRDSKIKELQNEWSKTHVLTEEQYIQLVKNKMERSKIYAMQVRKKIKYTNDS